MDHGAPGPVPAERCDAGALAARRRTCATPLPYVSIASQEEGLGMAAEAEEATAGSGSSGGEKEQEDKFRFLPIINIDRIMRDVVPKNKGKISKDAKESVQECVSEFIAYITNEANEKCKKERRKTMKGEDIIYSLGALGFDEYVEPLALYLKKYKDQKPQSVCSNPTSPDGPSPGHGWPVRPVVPQAQYTRPAGALPPPPRQHVYSGWSNGPPQEHVGWAYASAPQGWSACPGGSSSLSEVHMDGGSQHEQ